MGEGEEEGAAGGIGGGAGGGYVGFLMRVMISWLISLTHTYWITGSFLHVTGIKDDFLHRKHVVMRGCYRVY